MARKKLADGVLDRIGAEIALGRHPVGAAIPTETELMESLGVGRSSVREAIRVLASLGMVETAPRRGTIVAPRGRWNMLNRDVMRWLMRDGQYDPDLLAAINEARRIFEPASAALAARKASAAQILAVEAAYVQMEEAATQGDPDAAIEADRAFHLAIQRATSNPILGGFDAALDVVLGLLFSVTANHMDNFRDNLANHLRVVEAIRRKDPEAAEQAMIAMIDFTTGKMKQLGLIA